MSFAEKNDTGSAGTVRDLRRAGYSVEILSPSRRGGLPDLLVAKSRLNHLVELKSPGKKLSDKQQEWHDRWNGCIHVGRTSSQIIESLWICETITKHPLP